MFMGNAWEYDDWLWDFRVSSKDGCCSIYVLQVPIVLVALLGKTEQPKTFGHPQTLNLAEIQINVMVQGQGKSPKAVLAWHQDLPSPIDRMNDTMVALTISGLLPEYWVFFYRPITSFFESPKRLNRKLAPKLAGLFVFSIWWPLYLLLYGCN